MKKICIVCGGIYNSKTVRSKYCSTKCRNNSRYSRNIDSYQSELLNTKNKAINLIQQGIDRHIIAETLGMSYSYVCKVCYELGKIETQNIKYKRDQLIVKDRKAGMSMSDCAKKYGLKSVTHICKRYEVDGVLSNKPHEGCHDLRVTEHEISDRISKAWPGFEYVKGFKGVDSSCVIRCKVCGVEFERSLITLRSNKNIRCPQCYDNELTQKRSAKELLIKIERQRKQDIKELNRLNNTKQVELAKCDECGNMFITGKRRKYCSSKCAKKSFNKRSDKRLNEHNIIDKDITLDKLYKRDSGVCYICGIICDWDDYIVRDGVVICQDNYPSIEHVMPLSRGGKHSWENVRLACRRCNTLKRDTLPSKN